MEDEGAVGSSLPTAWMPTCPRSTCKPARVRHCADPPPLNSSVCCLNHCPPRTGLFPSELCPVQQKPWDRKGGHQSGPEPQDDSSGPQTPAGSRGPVHNHSADALRRVRRSCSLPAPAFPGGQLGTTKGTRACPPGRAGLSRRSFRATRGEQPGTKAPRSGTMVFKFLRLAPTL